MIQFIDVTKSYSKENPIFSNVNFSIKEGSWCYLRGKSGQGKSTLLKLVASFTSPDSGKIEVNDSDITKMRMSHLPYFRRRIGFIFQEYSLLDEATILDNIVHPLLIQGEKLSVAKERAHAALKHVSCEKLSKAYPKTLSGGEQQLVCIARAIINRPQIILADEPTANLDVDNAQRVIEVLRTFHLGGTTCIVSTHDLDDANPNNINIYIEDGKLSIR